MSRPSSRIQKSVHILGVPLDHGAGRRGVGMGPQALRIANLHDVLARMGFSIKDHGDLHVAAPETTTPGDPKLKYLPIILKACQQAAAKVEEILDALGLPLVVGGDHSIAIGTISGVASHLRKKPGATDPRLGVIWFDAHGDINTPETTPSGNIHGMPLACLLGMGAKELTSIGFEGAKLEAAKVAQIGLRDLDDLEKRQLRDSGVHAYTMADIDRRGMATVVEEALRIVTAGTDHLHVSFDVDSIDPLVAPGTGTRKMGGLTYREAHLGMEIIADSKRLSSLDVVEVNPTLDQQNQTAELAVELIASVLGKRIL